MSVSKVPVSRLTILTSIDSNNFDISVEGNLNILKNNIKIKKINFADKKIISKEDIEFYEKTFENIFLQNSFFETFNKDNVKEFIILVS